MKTKAFTLVELIVVITILAILGTIAFISLQGYSKDIRDVKRISDVRSLLSKINVEQTAGTPLKELIIEDESATGQILGIDNTPFQTMGGVDFENIGEDQDSFRDPIDNEDYYFAYAIGETGSGEYNFVQGMTKSETQGIKILGNYYTIDEEDVPSLFVEGGEYYQEGNTSIYEDNDDNDGTTNPVLCSEGYTYDDTQEPPSCQKNCEELLTSEWGYDNIPAINHNETTNNLTRTGSILGGTQTFTRNFTCNNGTFTANEETIINTACDAEYTYDSETNNCVETGPINNNIMPGCSVNNFQVGDYEIAGCDIGPNPVFTPGCPSGYHLPSETEWIGLSAHWGEDLDKMALDLDMQNCWAYWTSTVISGFTINGGNAYWVFAPCNGNGIRGVAGNINGAYTSDGRQNINLVRCFKN